MLFLIILVLSILYAPWYVTAAFVLFNVLVAIGEIGQAAKRYDAVWDEYHKHMK